MATTRSAARIAALAAALLLVAAVGQVSASGDEPSFPVPAAGLEVIPGSWMALFDDASPASDVQQAADTLQREHPGVAVTHRCAKCLYGCHVY